jgi:hypothetical protein
MDLQDTMNKLKQPFLPSEIEWRVGSTNADKTQGLALAYVTNRAIQQRLDDVFGCFGWKNEFKEWKGSSQICGISIKFDNEWITKWDGADDSNMEATKGGLSDAMKRAAYQWGIGRYLYNLPDVWVPLKNGKYLTYEPQLPDWALPFGFKYDQKPQNPPQQNKPVGNDNHTPGTNQAAKNDSVQPSDLEKRASKIYFTMTGNKEGQYGWPLETYKNWLKEFKNDGLITTDYGKKWTLQDVEFLESQIDELPF